MVRAPIATASLAACLTLLAGVASAGDPALDLFVKGREDLRSGRAAEALAELERSMDLLASPNTELLIGHAHRELGDRIKALADYEKTVAIASAKIREGEARFQPALADAERWAATLRSALAHVRVRVANVDAGGVVRVGGAVIDSTYDPARRALASDAWREPEDLMIAFESPRGERRERSVHATPGSDSVVDFDLGARGIRPPPLPSWIAFGVGGAAMVSFAVAGALANSATSTLEACAPSCNPTDPALISARDSGKTDALVANVSLGIGAAGLATGVLLWILLPASKTPKSGIAARSMFAVGPRSFSLSGSF